MFVAGDNENSDWLPTHSITSTLTHSVRHSACQTVVDDEANRLAQLSVWPEPIFCAFCYSAARNGIFEARDGCAKSPQYRRNAVGRDWNVMKVLG